MVTVTMDYTKGRIKTSEDGSKRRSVFVGGHPSNAGRMPLRPYMWSSIFERQCLAKERYESMTMPRFLADSEGEGVIDELSRSV